MQNSIIYILITFFVVGILNLLDVFQIFPIDHTILFASRWLALGLLTFYGIKKKSLTTWIFISMFLGAEFGHDFPDTAVNLKVLSQVFLRLVKTILAPLLFGTLVVGIASHSNLRQVGRMGIKSLIYFEVVTTIALFIGLGAINYSQAGVGIELPKVATEKIEVAPQKTTSEIILNVFPENIAKSIAEGHVLQIVIFSVIFAIALAMLPEEKKRPMLEFCESLSEVMFKFTGLIMMFAPVGVGAAIAYTVGHMGLEVLKNLIMLLVTLYVALGIFLLGVLLPIALAFRVPIKKFLKAISEPVSLAFATTSSDAALPLAIEKLEKFGVPKKIISFVLPTGYTFNLDGTTLYLALASVFVAQAAKIEMSFSQQIAMLLTLMLTSKGVAGVPRASLVILLGTASTFGLPTEPIFIILGIDELMDMARTAVNVVGNCLATVVIAKWEGEYKETEEPIEA
ncbi:MAG: cation:dicarboxylase symporter family transporter [Candidatus Sericytochromatia bacterium]